MLNETINLNHSIGANLSLGKEISVAEVIADVCHQIDDKILFCIMIILSCYVFRSIMLPRAKKEILPVIHKYFPSIYEWIEWGFDELLSLLETGALISSGFIVAVFILQKRMTLTYWIWLYAMGGIVGLIFIATSIGFIRNGGIKKTFNKTKTFAKESKEAIKEHNEEGAEHGKRE